MFVECYGCGLKMTVPDRLFGKPEYCLPCSKPQYKLVRLTDQTEEKPQPPEDRDEDFAF